MLQFSSQNPNPMTDAKPPALPETTDKGWEIIDIWEPEPKAINHGNTYSRIHGEFEVSLGWGDRQVKVFSCQVGKCVCEN